MQLHEVVSVYDACGCAHANIQSMHAHMGAGVCRIWVLVQGEVQLVGQTGGLALCTLMIKEKTHRGSVEVCRLKVFFCLKSVKLHITSAHKVVLFVACIWSRFCGCANGFI